MKAIIRYVEHFKAPEFTEQIKELSYEELDNLRKATRTKTFTEVLNSMYNDYRYDTN